MNEEKCRKAVKLRSGEDCEVRVPGVCQGRMTNYQHRKARAHCSDEELWAPSNGLAVCGFGNASGCHGWIHQHPTEAYKRGLSVRSWDTPIIRPVEAFHATFVLDDEGGYTEAFDFGGVA